MTTATMATTTKAGALPGRAAPAIAATDARKYLSNAAATGRVALS